MFDKTHRAPPGRNEPGSPLPIQFAVNALRDCVFIGTPAAGSVPDASPGVVRLYAGASSTRLFTLAGCCAA